MCCEDFYLNQTKIVWIWCEWCDFWIFMGCVKCDLWLCDTFTAASNILETFGWFYWTGLIILLTFYGLELNLLILTLVEGLLQCCPTYIGLR